MLEIGNEKGVQKIFMHTEKSQKSPVIIIALITAVSVLGNEMLFIVMPIYWKFFELTSLWQVGVLLSANRIIRILINPIVGWLYYKMKKRTGVLIAVTLAVVSTFSYGVLKGFWLLLLMRMVWGVAWSLLRLGGYLTVISSSNDRTRGHFIGLYNGLWGLGVLFGMLIGGVFVSMLGVQTITTSFTILGVCTIPFVLRYVPATKSEPEAEVSEEDGDTVRQKRKDLMFILANGLFSAFLVFGIFSSTLSKLLEFHMDDTVMILGFALGATALAGIIQALRMGLDPFIAPIIGKLSDEKFGRVPILMFALLLGALCFFTFAFIQSFSLLLFAIFLFQFTSTLLITTSDSLAADISQSVSSVKTMVYYTLFVDVGSALGPLVSYVVIDFVGIHSIYAVTAFLMIGMMLLWLRKYKTNYEQHGQV